MNNKEISFVMQKTGGATLTRDARETALRQFRDVLHKDLNIQVKSFKDLKLAHVKAAVDHLKADGRSDRTLQNLATHVRTALGVHGREQFAREIVTTKALSIGGASRDGTHRSLSSERIVEAVSKLDAGAAAAAGLQAALGPRAREAVMAGQSLASWSKELEKRGTVAVIHGTKGGRPRVVDLSHPEARKTAEAAISYARQVADRQDGQLIASASLQGACRAYQRDLAGAGLSGTEAGHALRYNFAQAQYGRLIELGIERREALARLSLDLGHGDGRGRYVRQVYLQGQEVGE